MHVKLSIINKPADLVLTHLYVSLHGLAFHMYLSCIPSLATFTVLKCVVHHIPNFLPVCREGEAEDSLPASRVLSSQIPGYDGGEVDTNETVEVMFSINVRKYWYLWSPCNTCYFYCQHDGSSAYTCTVLVFQLVRLPKRPY